MMNKGRIKEQHNWNIISILPIGSWTLYLYIRIFGCEFDFQFLQYLKTFRKWKKLLKITNFRTHLGEYFTCQPWQILQLLGLQRGLHLLCRACTNSRQKHRCWNSLHVGQDWLYACTLHCRFIGKKLNLYTLVCF